MKKWLLDAAPFLAWIASIAVFALSLQAGGLTVFREACK